jgi:hypothetical protein
LDARCTQARRRVLRFPWINAASILRAALKIPHREEYSGVIFLTFTA